MTKLGRIGIILGGPSSEREISIKSGKAVYEALLSQEQDAVCIDIKNSSSAKGDILREGIDIAFIALHGRFGEDGTLQQMLEDMKIPYTGSGPEASRLALNKILSRDIFRKNNIPVPRSRALKKGDGSLFSKKREPSPILDEFSFPFVVKPCNEGSSIGMSIIEKENEVDQALNNAFSYDDNILIEEYIPGEDITVGILNDRPLPVICIRPKHKFYDFESKYTEGMSDYLVPAPVSDDIKNEAQKLGMLSHQVLGCRCFSRIDMLFNKKNNKITVLEANTIPGLTHLSLLPKAAQEAGIDFAKMCMLIIKSTLDKK